MTTLKQAAWPELMYGSVKQIALANKLRVQLLKQVDDELQEAIVNEEYEEEDVQELLRQRDEIISVRNANFWINEKGAFFLNENGVRINAYGAIEEYEHR